MADLDSREHDRLEAKVAAELRDMGFLVASPTYHATMGQAVVDRLHKVYTHTSMYIRGRADRIAIHRDLNLVFQWEAKTHTSPVWNDMCIEVNPLMTHILLSREMGVACLYVYENPKLSKPTIGFWASKHPTVDAIWIPGRWNAYPALVEALKQRCYRFFSDFKILSKEKVNGSGDPFAVVKEHRLAAIPTWQELVRERVDAKKREVGQSDG